MSAQKYLLQIIVLIFSLTLVSNITSNTKLSHVHVPVLYHLCGLTHFLPRLLPRNFLCLQDGNSILWPSCLLWMWLSSDIHFALMMSPSPFGVETADQYR